VCGRDASGAICAGEQPGLRSDYVLGGGGSGATERESGRSLTAAAIVTWAIAGLRTDSTPCAMVSIGPQDASAWLQS
jgi:hypothetical protein